MVKLVKSVAKRFLRRATDTKEFVIIRTTSNQFVNKLRYSLFQECEDGENACLKLIEDRIKELQFRLSSISIETSFRHELKVMNAKEVFDKVSSPHEALRMLFRIVRTQRPEWSVEVGSAFGIGSIAIASAISSIPTAKFNGFEFEDWRAAIAAEGLNRLLGERGQIHHGAVEVTFPEIAKCGKSVDFAFVDAMHTFEASSGYHEMLLPHSRPGTVFVYDDINWSDGMQKFWETLAEDKRLSDVISVGGRWGIVRVN